MKAIILAAGYATRLEPLTNNMPKSLLEVAGKTILDFIVEKIDRVLEINEIIIATNDKFSIHFEKWREKNNYSKAITVVNDDKLTTETRFGAISDIQYVIDTLGINDDLIILAGDNLFDFELTYFINYFNNVDTDCITSYVEKNEAQVKRDESQKVLPFEEKQLNHVQTNVCQHSTCIRKEHCRYSKNI